MRCAGPTRILLVTLLLAARWRAPSLERHRARRVAPRRGGEAFGPPSKTITVRARRCWPTPTRRPSRAPPRPSSGSTRPTSVVERIDVFPSRSSTTTRWRATYGPVCPKAGGPTARGVLPEEAHRRLPHLLRLHPAGAGGVLQRERETGCSRSSTPRPVGPGRHRRPPPPRRPGPRPSLMRVVGTHRRHRLGQEHRERDVPRARRRASSTRTRSPARWSSQARPGWRRSPAASPAWWTPAGRWTGRTLGGACLRRPGRAARRSRPSSIPGFARRSRRATEALARAGVTVVLYDARAAHRERAARGDGGRGARLARPRRCSGPGSWRGTGWTSRPTPRGSAAQLPLADKRRTPPGSSTTAGSLDERGPRSGGSGRTVLPRQRARGHARAMSRSEGATLVTGYPGFIGKRLVEHIAAGVRGPHLRPGAAEVPRGGPGARLAGAGRARWSCSPATSSTCTSASPARSTSASATSVTDIFHLAAINYLGVPREMAWRVNVDGTRNVLELARDCRQAASGFDHFSTCYVVGRPRGRHRRGRAGPGPGASATPTRRPSSRRRSWCSAGDGQRCRSPSTAPRRWWATRGPGRSTASRGPTTSASCW